VFFLLLNSSIIVLFGYEKVNTVNNTKEVICYYLEKYPSTKWMVQWGTAHLMLYSIIPFIVLGISNLFLLQKSYKSFNNKNRSSTNAHINSSSSTSISKSTVFARSIIFNNLLFFIMTLPTAFCSFYFDHLLTTNNGKLFILLSNSISFSYHALNFFINCLTNIKFRHETYNIFCNPLCILKDNQKSQKSLANTHTSTNNLTNHNGSICKNNRKDQV
jgi:hypothetical protein